MMTARQRRSIDARIAAADVACAQSGAQLTELRATVLRLVLEGPGPLTAYQLLDRLKDLRGSAAPPTVYRALDFLMEHGLIHKVERLGAFVGCAETAQHEHTAQFLICGQCGTVAELDDHAVSDALDGAARRAGFRARSAMVEVEGTCAACATPA